MVLTDIDPVGMTMCNIWKGVGVDIPSIPTGFAAPMGIDSPVTNHDRDEDDELINEDTLLQARRRRPVLGWHSGAEDGVN
jgi:hypothetical protein